MMFKRSLLSDVKKYIKENYIEEVQFKSKQASFSDFKDFAVGHTIYQLSSSGDEFYIVHYPPKNSIKLLYPLKMYEYKEE